MEPGMWRTARTRTGIRPSRAVAGTLLAGLLLAGCASPVFAPGESSAPASDGGSKPLDRVHQQAHDALVRWADAVRESGGATISFVGELTSQIGEWEVGVGDNNKSALLAGMVQAVTALPTDTPSRREVKWLDDTKVNVKVLSAAAALEELISTGSDDCPDCEPLRVTEATLATGLVETSRGPAEAPMWVYGIAGSSVRITRVAVDDSIVVHPPPWNADDPPVGVSAMWAIGTEDARRLEVGFIGAEEDGTQPCGADYEAEAVESDIAVVVIITGSNRLDPQALPSGIGCRLEGHTRTVEVRLDAPLGDRAVLEIREGLPVPVHPPD
jgi:hypothetical protein